MTKQLSFTNTNTEHTNVGTSSLLQASSPTDLASSRHFFKLDHSFLFHYLPRVKPASIAVYVALGVHANRERLCWPSLATLAVYSGYRKARSVSKRLKELERAGVVDLQARRRASKLARLPFSDLPAGGFTPVTKKWLREFAPKIGPNALAVWFVLRAMANGRRRWRQAVNEILPLLQLSREGFDRAVKVLKAHGLIHTRRGITTEWMLLACNSEKRQIAPARTTHYENAGINSMNPETPTNPDKSAFELIDAKELSARLRVPVSWVRNRSSPSTPAGSRIPHTRLGGMYVTNGPWWSSGCGDSNADETTT